MEPFRSLPLREQRQGQGSRRKPLRGEGESANEPQCRQTFVLQHRIVTLIAQIHSGFVGRLLAMLEKQGPINKGDEYVIKISI